jgi:hypothetical protein
MSTRDDYRPYAIASAVGAEVGLAVFLLAELALGIGVLALAVLTGGPKAGRGRLWGVLTGYPCLPAQTTPAPVCPGTPGAILGFWPQGTAATHPPLAQVQTDSQGRYAIDLPPGTYAIAGTLPNCQVAGQPCLETPLAGLNPSSVVVTEGQIQRLDLSWNTGIA